MSIAILRRGAIAANRRKGTSGGANPASVPGLLRRWRADSIAQANGSAVSSWAALTGGVALTQATGTNQPTYQTSSINSLPGVRFVTDDWLAATITADTQPVSYVIVLKPNSTATYQTIVHNGVEIQLNPSPGGTGPLSWEMFGGTSNITGGSPSTNPVVLTAVSDTTSAVYANGASVVSGSAGTSGATTTINVGRHPSVSRPLNSDIAEILLYDHALTAPERATVHTYVQDRYAITVADYAGGGGSTASWLSGASGNYAGNGTFGTWRGRSVEIGGTWVNDPALYPFTAGGPGAEYATYNGPMDIGMVSPDWVSWAYEASGGHNTFWTNMFSALATKRAGKGTCWVRPWWEFNGNWYAHSVTSSDIANFKTAWNVVAGIARTQFPAVKMMIGAAASNGVSVADCWPTATVDALSIDFYNMWPWVTTQAGFDDKIENGAGVSSLEDLRRLAESKGVPVVISEWGNQGKVLPANEGGGGESPGFVDSFHAWLTAHAGTGPGQVIYEVYFNQWDDQFTLFTGPGANPLQPVTAAQYKLPTRFGG